MPPHDSDLYVGRELDGRWHVLDMLGEGNFSVVMRATDLTTGLPVAVKILKVGKGAAAEEELHDEIAYLRMLQTCDRVVDLKGEGSDVVFTTATLANGLTMDIPLHVRYAVLERADDCLANLLVGIDHVSWVERLGLFRDVVKGVHQMHLKRIASRDLKADNVLLFINGFVTVAKVADLGRARCSSDPPRRSPEEYSAGRGDFRFAPPEVFWWQGVDDADHWAAVDLFHLGSVLYELVTGHGITSVFLPNSRGIQQRTHLLSKDARKTEYEANLPALRAQMTVAWEPFEAALPKVIRADLTALLRQLTDPDPLLRVPRLLGRRPAVGGGLPWLLRRSDILRRVLANHDAQMARNLQRKTSRNGAA